MMGWYLCGFWRYTTFVEDKKRQDDDDNGGFNDDDNMDDG